MRRRYQTDIIEQVRNLRAKGWSLNDIQKKMIIPRTTIHGWTSDIVLTSEQKERLKVKVLLGLQEGKRKAQLAIKEKRVSLEQRLSQEGIDEIGSITDKELLIAGIALYWAEGFKNKHERRLGFCNSDPSMIRFYLRWLVLLGIGKKDLAARLTINKTYKEKAGEIEKYWSSVTDIPLTQFTKPFYQNTIWKKQFNNTNYFGVLRIHVKGSLEYLLKMRGWIEGLRVSLAG